MQGEGSRKREIDLQASLDRKLQILLGLKYREITNCGDRPSLDEIEFRTFSQNGEDGILLYIFSILGVANKKVVEICAGDGIECNSANLIINHGWHGLLFDGDADKVASGRHLYAQLADTFVRPPQLVHSWITAENVNQEICRHGFEGEIDLLSLDVDGNDYWIWKAIECISPRVVVLEYNASWGPHRCVTIPYDPEFRLDFSRVPFYCGASLAAFVALGRAKGYRLVGCIREQFNAFFVRADLGAADTLPVVSAAECLAYSTEHDWGERAWVDVSGDSEFVNALKPQPFRNLSRETAQHTVSGQIPEGKETAIHQELAAVRAREREVRQQLNRLQNQLRVLEDTQAETHRLVAEFSGPKLEEIYSIFKRTESTLTEINDRAQRALNIGEAILHSRTWQVLATLGGVIQRVARATGVKS